MVFTYDLTTDSSRVRLLINDRVETGAFFDDSEIAAFLQLEENTVFRAAALALETIASDEALVQKVIRLQDLTTDGAKTARVLLERAAVLRTAAAEAELMDTVAFDIAEQVPNQFAWRVRVWDQRQRGAL